MANLLNLTTTKMEIEDKFISGDKSEQNHLDITNNGKRKIDVANFGVGKRRRYDSLDHEETTYARDDISDRSNLLFMARVSSILDEITNSSSGSVDSKWSGKFNYS